MLISNDMPIAELITLMGDRASAREAESLRELLVRDFPGRNTDDIADGTWLAYCCAVDPEQQAA